MSRDDVLWGDETRPIYKTVWSTFAEKPTSSLFFLTGTCVPISVVAISTPEGLGRLSSVAVIHLPGIESNGRAKRYVILRKELVTHHPS